MIKVVCVIHPAGSWGTLGLDVPAVDGMSGYAVYLPAPDEPPEHPDTVGGVACVWLDRDDPGDPARWFPDARVDAYLVDERVQIDYERDWPDGQVSPGLHRIVFVRRAPALTREQMAAHWADRHAPLVRRHHPGFRQYAQNVVVEPVTADAPEVDGIAEMHFRSAADLRDRFYDSDEGRAVIAADVERFLDRGRGWRILAEEHWVLTPRTRSSHGR
jgi:uncharacterized protein (TIGR02118 family)